MSIDIAASLNERQRNALLSYYLGQYIPNSGDDTLISLVQTPEDVYEYLLIDPLVSNAVPTSRVAQAMSSIQQYINGITMNMEPGYKTQSLDQGAVSNWTEGLSQYDVWAGEVELDTYPENYIDPTLRQSQTAYFKDLITSLNQNTINTDTAQQAVMNYLNQFEQVANLTIVSGYIDGVDQTQSTYYFLGKSTTSPVQYYWRSFDMRQNVDNVVSTSAWSEWFPMNASINEVALQGLPRLTFFNNRLYLFWFERTTAGSNKDTTSDLPDGSTYDKITAYSSYCDFSNNWSAAYSVASVVQMLDETSNYYKPLFDAETSNLSTLCLQSSDSNKIVISLYTPTSSSYSDITVIIDFWFSTEVIQAAKQDDIPGLEYAIKYYSTKQNSMQSIYSDNESKYSLDSVSQISNSSYSDFSGGTLPLLENSNFSIAVDDDYVYLSYSIPFSFNTISYIETYTDDIPLWYFNDNNTTDQVSSGNMTVSYQGVNTSSFTNMVLGPINEDYLFEMVSIDSPASGVSFILDTPISYTVGSTSDNKVHINQTFSTGTPFTSIMVAFEQNPPYVGMSAFYTGSTSEPYDYYPLQQDKWNLYVYQDSWGGDLNKTFGPYNIFPTSGVGSGTLQIENTNKDISFTLYFGYERNDSKSIHTGYTISVKAPTVTLPPTPSIVKSHPTSNGVAIYLDFGQSTFSDGITDINNIRLNTLFAKELINKATVSTPSLLSWDTQLTLEPPMTDDGTGNPTPMDFSGANGIYFWELFFYMPYLVAWRLNQEQQYSDAQAWYCYIFDPSARGRDNSSTIRQQYPEPDYWSVRPLVETTSGGAQAVANWLTTDPDALASASPVHYQKSIFMAYVSNLIAIGDASYRLLTSDGLALARLQYGQVKDLLGFRPDALIVNHWAPESLSELEASTQSSVALTEFESHTPAMPAFPGQSSVADTSTTSDVFMAPLNTQLLGYWNTLDSRLYNLRHQLTIDGQPMTVPLYAPPVNPTILMEQSVQGGSLVSTSSGIVTTVPPFRFISMLQSARSAVSTLSQFGQTLLSYCERQDAASLQELDAQLAFNISGYTLTLQQNAIDAMDADKVALQSSLTMAQQRQEHYQALYDENTSAGEISAMTLWDSASATQAAASTLLTTGTAMNTVPNIFGLADGGEKIGNPTLSAGIATQIAADVLALSARQTDMSEGYKRRREEWQIQYQQAQSEVGVINNQLSALAIRRTGAVTALQLAQAQQDNLKSTLNFLTTRFSQSALYNWLAGQLSALYYQAYDATLSLCLSAEACWQYEMGDITSRFIQTGTWNDNYRGLLVGEALQLNLQQMESAWLNRYARRLELTRTVSLKNLKDSAGTAQIDWTAFTTGTAAGTATFSLSESLFDNDYPGHYLRQIKSVTVTLPALVGPYQDVRMTLTQSGSRVLLKADIGGVNYLNDPKTGSSTNILLNPRASQQVAVSSGLNDAGLFMLSFGDERYLPFEGTGAISDWQIAFPNPTSDEQKALLASLNDVIVQVHYTALYGGSSFEQAVTGTL